MMKRKTLALICLCLALLLAACGKTDQPPQVPEDVQPVNLQPQTQEPPEETTGKIWDFTDRNTAEFAADFDADQVEKVIYVFEGYYGQEYVLTGTEDIQEVFQALDQITVVKQTDEWADDYGDVFYFLMKDASRYSIRFNMHHLEMGSTVYLLEHDGALWQLANRLREQGTEDRTDQETQSDALDAAVETGGAGRWSYTMRRDGDGNIEYRFDTLAVVLPADWEGKYTMEVYDDGVSFYHTASLEKWQEEYGFTAGWLFSVSWCEDDSYLELPAYRYIGTDSGGGSYYMAFPTDVQAFYEDESVMQEWAQIQEGMGFVEEHAVCILPQ